MFGKRFHSFTAVLCCLMLLAASFGMTAATADADPVAAAQSAIDAIGLVSYRLSVLGAIEAAEAAFGALDDAQKAQVGNADVLTAARAEYDRLEAVVSDLKIVWKADTSTAEGVDHDGSELTVETLDSVEGHEGEHWVVVPTANYWSVWGTMSLDISGYDFNQLTLGVSLRRTGGEDSWLEIDLRNAADQRMLGSGWYEQIAAQDGEWTYFEMRFTDFENGLAGIEPWPKWTAEDWNSNSPMSMFRLCQPANVAGTLEIDSFVIYNEGADVQSLIDEANEVVDRIAAIGEITSAAQDEAVSAARGAYDALSESQQSLVTNAEALRTMELAVRQYKTAANVVAAIDAIGEITLDNLDQKREAVLDAREAYNAYHEKYADDTLITNLADLIAAEQLIAGKRADDINALKALITAIGEVTKENSAEALAKIEAAEAARDSLIEKYGDEVLDEVDNLADLEAARAKYEELNPDYVLGDINADGKIDASDALLALQHSVNLTKLEGAKFAAADVNHDDKVDASDALMILQKSVGLITEFPAAE